MNDVTLTNLFGSTDDRDAGIRRLEAAARRAWADGARGRRWTLWARLSFASHVSEITSSKHIENWATQFIADVPGSAILIGLHHDTERRHAHALIFVPRRWHEVTYPHGIEIVGWSWEPWLRWRHGQVWVDRFSPGHTSREHGAAEYLARDPGSVLMFGTAPRYQPRRRR